jgi:hypothetical protein
MEAPKYEAPFGAVGTSRSGDPDQPDRPVLCANDVPYIFNIIASLPDPLFMLTGLPAAHW